MRKSSRHLSLKTGWRAIPFAEIVTKQEKMLGAGLDGGESSWNILVLSCLWEF